MPDPVSPVVKVLLSQILPWSFALIGGVLLYYGNQELSAAKAMTDWARTKGHVISSSVESTQYGTRLTTRPSYHALVVYEYQVEGTVFHGTRLRFGDHAFRRPADAQAVANRYPVGRAVRVYYDPLNVTEAALEPRLPRQPYAVLGTGSLFILMWLCLAVFMRREH